MPFCTKCGVEVDDFTAKCPLCNTPIQKLPESEQPSLTNYPVSDPDKGADRRKMDKHAVYFGWMILSVALFTPLFVILTIGIQLNALDTWAGYPVFSLVAAWICGTIIFFLRKRPVIATTCIMVSLGILLFCFDFLRGGLTWFFPVGLPLLLLFYVLSTAVVMVSTRVKEKGLNIGAFIMIASGIFCIGMDILFSAYTSNKIIPTWSTIVISALFPLALFLLLLQYLLKKKIKFKRFFHL
ncbi:MAG: hypothetical protein JW969_16570 [Spirochaetales bacterium]|nr:hypothetical protein [Spirochaetales bacterium]